jgi:hypothetical protein
VFTGSSCGFLGRRDTRSALCLACHRHSRFCPSKITRHIPCCRFWGYVKDRVYVSLAQCLWKM